ncbi:LytTR family DNA-binding domain-containing protein [Paraflavitalea speifideaquila]|uniref:LytR/AlgR family response regulator transcription factor n=1 Tax=Paraflavitalea speifideaquila TaxID=3076558 RepID=UPI0028ED4131|nr:LytTR family DNA-binding domain-containing protein [Paraflavitalea speifideiaquila]
MNDYIFVKNNYVFVKIKLADLLYMEADNNYVHVITLDRKLVLRLSLSQLLEKINYKPLVRIHRSYAVNINAIQSFNDQEVQINKAGLPIGRNYKEAFLKISTSGNSPSPAHFLHSHTIYCSSHTARGRVAPCCILAIRDLVSPIWWFPTGITLRPRVGEISITTSRVSGVPLLLYYRDARFPNLH